MKRIIITAALALGATSANARSTLLPSQDYSNVFSVKTCEDAGVLVNVQSALALQAWLIREGWSGEEDIFLDLDPERGIVAGQRWARALEDAATRCEAVLFLVSEVIPPPASVRPANAER